MATSNLPPLKMKYHRSLLNEVKLGRGTHMKQLRDELEARPTIKRKYMQERDIELGNAKQREKMMWVKDSNSHVHRVENEFRELCTYTNPTHAHQVPDKQFVKKIKEKQAFDLAWKEVERKAEQQKTGSKVSSFFC